MTFSIITLFPQAFDSIFSYSILARAQKEGRIKIKIINLRDFGTGRHKIVDDKPYGGGVGMVLRVDVVTKAIEAAQIPRLTNKSEAVILLDPKGERFKQETAEKLMKFKHLILICGHYEGFDERIRARVDYEISIGDYILSGGEIAAAIVVETVSRLVGGVLKKPEATLFESFSKGKRGRILEHPHYTRPKNFHGQKVPETLLSGNFKRIDEYREEEAKKITQKRRPDL